MDSILDYFSVARDAWANVSDRRGLDEIRKVQRNFSEWLRRTCPLRMAIHPSRLHHSAASTGVEVIDRGLLLTLRGALTAAHTASSRRSRGRRQGRLRPKHLGERLVGAHLIGISPADSNRANQLIVHDDG
jgi:hypothetical protein